jgi:hypothetical protein
VRRIAVIAVCAAIGLASAVASSASASAAKVLELSTSEGSLAVGAQLSLLSGRVLQTSEGSVECPTSILLGNLASNRAAKDRVTITAGAPTGPHGVVCSGTTALGSVEVQAGGLPWTQEFAVTGKAKLKGKKKLSLTVTVPALLFAQCTYEAPALAETFSVGAVGVPTALALQIAGQTFARAASSSPLCPSQITAGATTVSVAAYNPDAALLPVSATRR